MVKFSVALFCFLVVLGLAHVGCVNGRHHSDAPVPAPSSDCSSIIYDMADCISFVSNGSEEAKPTKDCCNGLKTVLQTDPDCVCVALQTSSQMGIVVNVTRAMALPSACAQKAPPMDNCGLPDVPSPSPSPSPVNPPPTPSYPPQPSPPTPSSPPQPAPAPSDDNVPDAPAPAPSDSAACTTSISLAVALFSLVVASLF